jgi:DNA primase
MSRSLKDGEIEELKSRCDIKEIVSGYINLKKAGRNYTGLCPFHKEKTPSFSVDPVKQFFHCFGCGQGGDILSFIQKIENLDFVEAAEMLAKKVNYNLKYNETGDFKPVEKKSKLIELNELAKKYYNYILFNNKAGSRARNYLEKRKLEDDTLQKFEAGYSPDGWRNLTEYAQKKGFSNVELVECGLAIQSSRNKDEAYDRFRDRIIFPIKDVVGRTVGFGGRVIQDVKGSAKYINTPETKIYSKSKNIYGIFEAKGTIVEKDHALIVEGYTDVIALHQKGIRNAVASCGTALTSEQVQLISRFSRNIVLVFDSDNAGENASLKGIERLKEYNERLDLFHDSNIDIKVAILEKGYDPADYVLQKNAESFLEKVSGAIDIIDFSIMMILKKYNIENYNDRLRASGELIEFVASFSSKIVQEDCIRKISGKLKLSESLLFEQLIKTMQKKVSKFSSPYTKDSGKPEDAMIRNPVRNIEIEALKILVNGIGEKFGDILALGEKYFKFRDTKRLYEVIADVMNSQKNDNSAINFPLQISSDKFDDDSAKNLYDIIIFSPISYSDYDFASKEVFNNLNRIFITENIEEVKSLLKKVENFLKNLNKEEILKEDLLIKKQKAEDKIKDLNLKLIDLEKEKNKFCD